MIKVNEVSLLDLAPKGLLKDNTTRWIYESIDYALKKKHNKLINKFYLDSHKLSDREVDYLMWEYSIEPIDDITYLEKRELLKQDLVTHFNKGTIGSIKKVCEILFDGAEVIEWFEYDGQPGNFKVVTEGNFENRDGLTRAIKVVNQYKNARSHLESIDFKRSNRIVHYQEVINAKRITNIIKMRVGD